MPTPRLLSLSASLFVAIASVALVAAGRVEADQIKVINSTDGTSRFVALGIGQSVMMEFAQDLREVLVADPHIAKTVILTAKRIHVIAARVGQTDIFFYGADGRQIGALNVAVLSTPPGAGDELPPNDVTVFRGNVPDPITGIQGIGMFLTIKCGPWPARCVDPRQPGADQPPGTQNINIMGNAAGAANVPVGLGR